SAWRLRGRAVLERDRRRAAELLADARRVGARTALIARDGRLLPELELSPGDAFEDRDRLPDRSLDAAADVQRPLAAAHRQDRGGDHVGDVRALARLRAVAVEVERPAFREGQAHAREGHVRALPRAEGVEVAEHDDV